MSSEPKNRRRQLVVDRELQSRVMKDIGALPLVVLVLGVLVMGFFSGRVLSESEASGVDIPSVLPLFAAAFAFVVLASFSLLTQGLRISNRVAGPQVRFRRVTNEVIDDDARGQNIRLRESDYVHETAADFNRLIVEIDRLRGEVDRLRSEVDRYESEPSVQPTGASAEPGALAGGGGVSGDE